VIPEVKELARAHTSKAIETLVSIMTNPKSADAARVSAANALLDRGYGKPPQHQHVTGADGPQYAGWPLRCGLRGIWCHHSLSSTPTSMALACRIVTRVAREIDY
jgi:hypothetical protein